MMNLSGSEVLADGNTSSPPALEKLRATQTIARESVLESISFLKEGWSEAQAASLLETVLRDNGVQDFFHKPFVWFGERTRFQGIGNYAQFQPKKNRFLAADEVVIFDVAPIYHHVSADIGYTFCLQAHAELDRAKQELRKVRHEILQLFQAKTSPRAVWKAVDQTLEQDGYETVHKRYPLKVLGHRLYNHPQKISKLSFLHFGLEAYRSLLRKGLYNEIISPITSPSMLGAWAIEPHLGTKTFGAKFEEILVVTEDTAYWLDKEFI